MIHEGLFLLIKSLDSTGNYEKEKALRTAWENRIKHTEVLTALLKELEIDLDDYRFSCIEGDMTVSELLKIRTSASPELTKEEEK
jgi:hypothetical protein